MLLSILMKSIEHCQAFESLRSHPFLCHIGNDRRLKCNEDVSSWIFKYLGRTAKPIQCVMVAFIFSFNLDRQDKRWNVKSSFDRKHCSSTRSIELVPWDSIFCHSSGYSTDFGVALYTCCLMQSDDKTIWESSESFYIFDSQLITLRKGERKFWWMLDKKRDDSVTLIDWVLFHKMLIEKSSDMLLLFWINLDPQHSMIFRSQQRKDFLVDRIL